MSVSYDTTEPMTLDLLNIATELDEYMRLRAAIEGVAYELDAPWLAQQLEQLRVATGSPTVRAFGVYIKDEQLMSDDQEPSPGFFEAWKRSKSVPAEAAPISPRRSPSK